MVVSYSHISSLTGFLNCIHEQNYSRSFDKKRPSGVEKEMMRGVFKAIFSTTVMK